jgi:outer membrane protein
MRNRIVIALLLLGAGFSFADAQDSAPDTSPSPWDMTSGGGAILRPTYEGSNRYIVAPMPLVRINWNDVVTLDDKGLYGYWHQGQFKAGGGATYGDGRRESQGTEIFNQGDDRLKGMGNIAGAVGLRTFASCDFDPVVLELAGTRFFGSDNKGTLADLTVSVPRHLAGGITLVPHIGATWADRRYMETFFGVSPQQSARSDFPPFSAGAGLKDAVAGLRLIYRFDRHWLFYADADFKELAGDAADSPLAFARASGALTALLGYHF